jgi:hypothetical protein
MAPVNRSKNASPPKDAAQPKDDSAARPANAVPPSGDRAPGASVPERAARWMLLLLIAAFGVGVGALGSFGHRADATWLGVSWPAGLLLCFGGLVGLLLGVGELLEAGAARSWQPTRLSALGCASAGWLLALLWLTYLGPPLTLTPGHHVAVAKTLARKGDVILANDWKSMAYLLGGMALVTAAVFRAWAATLTARLGARPGAPGSVHPKG